MLSASLRSEAAVQFRRYSVVGLAGFVVDFGIYGVLTRLLGVHYLLANAVSFSCAVVNNFVWHKLWTFRRNHVLSDGGTAADASAANTRFWRLGGQFSVFVMVSVIGLGLNSFLLHTISQLPVVQAMFGARADFFAKVVAVGVVWMWNFSINRLWTFRKG